MKLNINLSDLWIFVIKCAGKVRKLVVCQKINDQMIEVFTKTNFRTIIENKINNNGVLDVEIEKLNTIMSEEQIELYNCSNTLERKRIISVITNDYYKTLQEEFNPNILRKKK